MSVYVDPLRTTFITEQWPYRHGCHMFADSVRELDAFAAKLKLKVGPLNKGGWRHNIHYDLTAQVRQRAIKEGAIEIQHGDGTYTRVCKQCYDELHAMGQAT